MYQEFGYDLDAVMEEARETGLLSALFTAQKPDGVYGGTGAPSGDYVDVLGLVDIPCQDAPETDSSIRAHQNRMEGEIEDQEIRHVLLDRYYPSLEAGWRGTDVDSTGPWRATVDARPYTIAGVESDSQRTQTRVRLVLVTI